MYRFSANTPCIAEPWQTILSGVVVLPAAAAGNMPASKRPGQGTADQAEGSGKTA
ncbi:MAG: hypothetical protein H6739_20135 [Alphaproteobacteria bacterium]|nr:hypothetical protein [Alphaproteobacteria bacterium]